MIMLHVEQLKGGFDDNFSYLVWDTETKDAAIFDASVKPERHLELVAKHKLHLRFVFIMHSHFDHLVGMDEYRRHGILLYGHESLAAEVDALFPDQATLMLGHTPFRVLHAPGHRFDCVLLHGDGKVFTTDVVFVGACGRCDLEGSEPEKMYETLYKVFGSLPKETIVYPGHDYGETPASTVAHELQSNPYLVCTSKEEFLKTRMRQ